MGGEVAKAVKPPAPRRVAPPPTVTPEPPTSGYTGQPGGNALDAIQQVAKPPKRVVPAGPPRIPNPARGMVRDALDVAALLVAPGLAPDTSLIETAIERAAARAVIELRDHPRFKPDYLVGLFIQQAGDAGAVLRAQYAKVANGRMTIRWDGCTYQADPVWLPIHDPELVPREPGVELGLMVWMTDGVFCGNLATASGTQRLGAISIGVVDPDPSQDRLFSIVFGRSYHGRDSLVLQQWQNELSGGYLRVAGQYDLHPPDGPTLSGLFSYFDGDFRFMAHGQLGVEGADADTVDVVRSPKGILRAFPRINFAETWQAHGFTGGIEANFFDGSFEARGIVKLDYPFLSGEMTVVATSWKRAWEAANANDPSPHVTGGIASTNPTDAGLALVAWGRLDLILAPGSPEVPVSKKHKKAKTDPLKARATFLVDPAGDITVRGILRLPSEYVLVPAYTLDPDPWLDIKLQIEGTNIIGPFGAAVRLFAKIVPTVVIGPVTLRDLTADGAYSTRPGVGSAIELQGRFNASAEAGIKAEAGIQVAATVGLELGPLDLGFDIGSVDTGVVGRGSIRGYVDAFTKVKRKGGTAEAAPEYSIHGDLHVAGEIVANVGLAASFSIDDLIDKQVSAGKEFRLARGGVRVKLDHVFGSGKLPEVTYDKVDFDAKKFVKAMITEKLPKPSGEKVHGEFHDRDLNGDAKVTGTATPARPPPPDRPFELHVPFAIETHHHDLFLVVKPADQSVLEMSSPTRKRVLEAIDHALDFVDHQLDGATDPDLIILYKEQLAELKRVRRAAAELIAEANALAPELEHLWEADLPDLDDVAADLAEYGARYGDDEITGAARLLSGPIAETDIGETTPRRYRHRGAERIGTSNYFKGRFEDGFDWADFPDKPILQHPVNYWAAGGFVYPDTTIRHPERGAYETGRQTEGWDARPWRRHLAELVRAKIDEGLTTAAARNTVREGFADAGFTGLSWNDLELEGGGARRWQGHHVHERSWDGPHDVSNIQYLALDDHKQASKWWEDQRDDIELHLQIPKRRQRTP